MVFTKFLNNRQAHEAQDIVYIEMCNFSGFLLSKVFFYAMEGYLIKYWKSKHQELVINIIFYCNLRAGLNPISNFFAVLNYILYHNILTI